MNILGPVATDTVLRRFYGVRARRVAGGTIGSLVFTGQGKFGVPVMAELHVNPFGRGMATFAIRTKAALVNIIDLVALNAGLGQTFPYLANMARVALQFQMRTDKSKLCGGMVKSLHFGPVCFAVATCAIGA